ncbi:hypothetical protein DL546_000961 [Coniochaeta pulveracea]|uniref:Uncharacterized protein n=1 Tax=Coniochaeta pulveracea TaxID=177199 RepID=A0A420Y0T6_9PEZI|nr:hypothetical protein DL546_000961 [Coniochaeta pulveracea]
MSYHLNSSYSSRSRNPPSRRRNQNNNRQTEVDDPINHGASRHVDSHGSYGPEHYLHVPPLINLDLPYQAHQSTLHDDIDSPYDRAFRAILRARRNNEPFHIAGDQQRYFSVFPETTPADGHPRHHDHYAAPRHAAQPSTPARGVPLFRGAPHTYVPGLNLENSLAAYLDLIHRNPSLYPIPNHMPRLTAGSDWSGPSPVLILRPFVIPEDDRESGSSHRHGFQPKGQGKAKLGKKYNFSKKTKKNEGKEIADDDSSASSSSSSSSSSSDSSSSSSGKSAASNKPASSVQSSSSTVKKQKEDAESHEESQDEAKSMPGGVDWDADGVELVHGSSQTEGRDIKASVEDGSD